MWRDHDWKLQAFAELLATISSREVSDREALRRNPATYDP